MLESELIRKSTTISLVGMPGGGKSTVGRHLGRRLSTSFVDSDGVIEKRTGCSISALFDQQGEAAFRDIESQVIAELIASRNGVIATGGGAILRESTREKLRTETICVYLRSTPEELFRRLRHDSKRPMLQVVDPLARLRELFAARDALYREVAHFVIDTGRPSVPTLVNMILMQLELSGVLDPAKASSAIHLRPTEPR